MRALIAPLLCSLVVFAAIAVAVVGISEHINYNKEFAKAARAYEENNLREKIRMIVQEELRAAGRDRCTD